MRRNHHAGRHVLSIWMQTQAVSAVTGHRGSTFKQPHHRKKMSSDKQCKEVTHPFTPWQTPHIDPHCCKVETAVSASHPAAKPAAVVHPRGGTGNARWDGMGVGWFNRGQGFFLFCYSLHHPSPRRAS